VIHIAALQCIQRMLRHLRAQVLGRRGEVDGRRLNVTMPQHPREAIDIAPAFEHERRKGMAAMPHSA
jgi:hypothetical protein